MGKVSRPKTRPAENTWAFLFGLRAGEGIGFSLAVAFPQDLEITFLRAAGLKNFSDLELPFWGSVLYKIQGNAACRKVDWIERPRSEFSHKKE
jgi:hypothetical protein